MRNVPSAQSTNESKSYDDQPHATNPEPERPSPLELATGKVLVTQGIRRLPDPTRSRIADAVQDFNSFTPDNDPHDKYDFGGDAG